MKDVVNPHAMVSGSVRGHLVYPMPVRAFDPLTAKRRRQQRWWVPQGDFEHNEVMYDWATIVGELLRGAPDGKPYKLGGMYIEFENNGGAPVYPPSFDRDDGVAYYNGLSASATRDYLRVPMTVIDLDTTDVSNFPGGNRVTCFARTDGVTGVHGKTFSNAVSSRVFGAALVAFPAFGDATQDLVFSRFYWSNTDNQIVKATGSQIGLEWPITLQ